jgi:biotin-(acetyl-CoA carboxylase) ligase
MIETQGAKPYDPSLIDLKIKWPNDIMLNGKKVAGVICEYIGYRDGTDWISIGIGVNLLQKKSQLPKNCKTEPTSLWAEEVLCEGNVYSYVATVQIALENILP